MKKLTNFINEAEKSKKQKEYQDFFTKKLKEFGVDSPAELSDADKKKFFNEVDKEWTQEPTNEKRVEEDYDSEEDKDSKKMKSKKESYGSKMKEEEIEEDDYNESEDHEDHEMEEDSYNESSEKKVKEGLNPYINKSVKSKKRDFIKNPKIGDSVTWEDRGNLFRGTIEKIEGNIAIIDHMNSNGKYVKRQVDKTKLFNEGVYEAKKIKEKDAKKRLEQIRKSLRREDLSYGEIAELEALSDFIEADDIELRQAAGLPEFNEGVYEAKKSDIEKGTKVVIKGTPFDGEEGIIASEDMHDGKYIVQLGDSWSSRYSKSQIKGFKPSEILVKEGVYEHDKGETAEIHISKDDMEKLHKDGKVDIDKKGVIFSLIFKHNESMHEAKLNESKKDILNTLNDLAATLYDKKDKRHKMIGDFIDKMEDQFTIRELSSLLEAKLN